MIPVSAAFSVARRESCDGPGLRLPVAETLRLPVAETLRLRLLHSSCLRLT